MNSSGPLSTSMGVQPALEAVEHGRHVTREQIAVMLYKYAVQTGHTAGERGNLSGFPDAGSVSSWAGDPRAYSPPP